MNVQQTGRRMAHYPTLQYSQFRVQADSLPAHLRPPPDLETTLPPICDFELEEKVLKEFEASQAAAEKLAAATDSANGAAAGDGKPPCVDAAAGGLGGLSLDGKEARERAEKVARMRELTNSDESTCRMYLESFNWDLERASMEFFNK